MLGPAVISDLTSRSLTVLSSTQQAVALTKLDDAYVQIITAIPSVATRLTAVPLDTVFEALVIQIQCAAVLRFLQNPDGKYQEAGDDYSFSRDHTVASGQVYITDDELALIADTPLSGGSFTITPAGTTPGNPWATSTAGIWGS
jgi:hypothetical protein